jgi:peptide deformylase
MSILKVARLGNPVLVRRAVAVEPRELASGDLQRLVDDMVETMRDERGVGLAAPQVHRSLRLFVMDPGERADGSDGAGLTVVVNPILTFPGEETIRLWEGCLSIPGLRGITERRAEVHVEFLDRRGRPQSRTFRGFPAAVVQHETDHLDGVLFLQRMPDLSRLAFEDELARAEPPEDQEGAQAEEHAAGAESGVREAGERPAT